MKEKLTQAQYTQLGRMATKYMPDLVKQIEEKYTPAQSDIRQIPTIWKKVQYGFPELDRTDQFVLTIACVYFLYCPAALIAEGVVNAPAGVRRAIADAIEYNNGTMINYFLGRSRVHMKNRRYIIKVETITAEFKSKSHDIQRTN